MFDAIKSKLYPQIMERLCSFLGLPTESTTETEIHAALESQVGTLAEQLENAKNGTDALAKVQELEGKFSEMQTQLSAIADQLTERNARIEELQTELQALQTEKQNSEADAIAAAAQQQERIKTLSGEIARLKSGAAVEPPVVDNPHQAAKETVKPSNGPIKIVNPELAGDLGFVYTAN